VRAQDHDVCTARSAYGLGFTRIDPQTVSVLTLTTVYIMSLMVVIT
jgi:hypothetical protein